MSEREPSPLERLAADPIAPPADHDEEPTDANPVPLSPTERKRRHPAHDEQASVLGGGVARGIVSRGPGIIAPLPETKDDTEKS
jgi:hypothetical protein